MQNVVGWHHLPVRILSMTANMAGAPGKAIFVKTTTESVYLNGGLGAVDV